MADEPTKLNYKRKRARTQEGHFVADDPSTPDVNEAYEPVEEKQPAKAADPTGTVVYESREKEPSMFPVAGFSSTRNFSTGRLEYEVPASEVVRFEANHFFMNGRVIRRG